MNLFHWVCQLTGRRRESKSEAIVRRVARSFPYPATEIEPGLWDILSEQRDTYQVSLFLWAEGEMICLRTACELSIERDLILREMMLLLLEENHKLPHGSFRLVPSDEKRLVVLGASLDTRHVPESKLRSVGEMAIENMQRMICKLYAMGLIISGREEHIDQSNRRKQK